MHTVTCKIMLSSVVVEHCCLFGSECAGESFALVGCGIVLESIGWNTGSVTVFVGEL